MVELAICLCCPIFGYPIFQAFPFVALNRVSYQTNAIKSTKSIVEFFVEVTSHWESFLLLGQIFENFSASMLYSFALCEKSLSHVRLQVFLLLLCRPLRRSLGFPPLTLYIPSGHIYLYSFIGPLYF